MGAVCSKIKSCFVIDETDEDYTFYYQFNTYRPIISCELTDIINTPPLN